MPELGEGDGDEHEFTGQDVKQDHGFIVKPLMIGEKTCEKWGDCNQ